MIFGYVLLCCARLNLQPPGPVIPLPTSFCRLTSPPKSDGTFTVADVTSVRAGRGRLERNDALV